MSHVDATVVSISAPDRSYAIAAIDTCNYFVPTEISPLDIQSQISLHPNPVAERLYVSSLDKISSITITDVAGHTWIKEVRPANEEIDVTHLPPGAYVVSLVVVDGCIRRNLVTIIH